MPLRDDRSYSMYIYSQFTVRPLANLSLPLLLLLHFLQPPQWCMDDENQCESQPRSGIPSLPAWMLILIEGVLISVQLAGVLLKIASQSTRRYFGSKRFYKGSICCVLALIVADYCIRLVMFISHHSMYTGAASGFLFTALVSLHFRRIRYQMLMLISVIPGYARITVLLLSFMLFFAWLGTQVFNLVSTLCTTLTNSWPTADPG